MPKTLEQNECNEPEYDIEWDDTGESLLHLQRYGALEPIDVESSESAPQPTTA